MKIINRIQKSAKLRNIKTYCWDFIFNGILSSYFIPCQTRKFFMNLFGAKIAGEIHADCYIASKRVYLGRNSYINRSCCLDNRDAYIIIGDNSAIGFNVSILCTNHDTSNAEKRSGKVCGKNVIIGNGVWIAANVVICPGVIIEDGTVVAAGSVVKQNCMKNSLYAGVPAIKKKKL